MNNGIPHGEPTAEPEVVEDGIELAGHVVGYLLARALRAAEDDEQAVAAPRADARGGGFGVFCRCRATGGKDNSVIALDDMRRMLRGSGRNGD